MIIALSGSRSIKDQIIIDSALDQVLGPIHAEGLPVNALSFRLGDAIGVDQCGLNYLRARDYPRTIYYADRKGYEFWEQARPMREWPAELEHAISATDWARDGRSAGTMRNRIMLAGTDYQARPDILIGIWDGQSSGTGHALAHAAASGEIMIIQFGGARPIGPYTDHRPLPAVE